MARTRRGAEAAGRCPGFLSQARHVIALGDGVSVPAVGAGEGAQVLRATFWGPGTQTVAIGVQSYLGLALRSGFSSHARIASGRRIVARGAGRGLLVLAAVSVSYVLGRYPAGSVDASRSG